MTLIVDAGPLVAMADAASELGRTCHAILLEEPGELVLSAYAAAEADYLIDRELGRAAERRFLEDLASGVYAIEALNADEYGLAREVDASTPGLGLADLSIVVLAARFRTDRIMTFDERDFRRVRPLDRSAFTLLPADTRAGADSPAR